MAYRAANNEAWKFLLSIDADAFLPVSTPGQGGEISVCALVRNKKDTEMLAFLICRHLLYTPYVYSPDDIHYIERMEKSVYRELPLFRTYDDAGRAFQKAILESILNKVVESAKSKKDEASKFEFLNKVIGTDLAHPVTYLSKFLRECGNDFVISSLRKELGIVRGKAIAAKLPAYDEGDDASAQAESQTQEFTTKPEPAPVGSSSTAVVLHQAPYAFMPPPQEVAKAPSVDTPPVTQDPLILKAFQALEEKHQREMDALRSQVNNVPQAHQDALAEKDKTIAELRQQLKTQNAVVRAQSIQIAGLKGQQIAAKSVLSGTVILSDQDNSGKDGYVPLGIRARPTK